MSNDEYHALIEDLARRLEFMRSSGIGGIYIKRPGLSELERDVGGCTRCVLHRTRSGIYMGSGGATPEAVLIAGTISGSGEGRPPGPFKGEGGVLLEKIIKAMDLREDKLFLCYAVKCVLPPDRPEGAEGLEEAAAACGGFLRAQLKALAPKLVIALGGLASLALLDTADVSALRGRVHDLNCMGIVATYGIDDMLKDRGLRREVWKDIQMGLRRLRG